MQPMPEVPICNAGYAEVSLTDSILQIRLTLTFAVIVSTYVAGKRFDRPVYLLASGLYLFASAIELLRFCSAPSQAFHYKNLLNSRSLDPWPVPNAVSILIAAGSALLMLAVTIGTRWFVRLTWRKLQANQTGVLSFDH